MNKTLEIQDFEDKKTQAGKPYVRFKTSEGWMSCFDSTTFNELKKQIGITCVIDVKTDEEKGFVNILKYIGKAEKPIENKSGTSNTPYREGKECHLSVEQVRSNALHEAVKICISDKTVDRVSELAKKFEIYLNTGVI